MRKFSLLPILAILFVGLAAGEGCDWGTDTKTENICKNRSETGCKADPECQWKLKDDGSYVCKPA